jgi:hypothetical protein
MRTGSKQTPGGVPQLIGCPVFFNLSVDFILHHIVGCAHCPVLVSIT